MKTAERILLTSLELFNSHGEAGVNSVDIALELNISPGNLYYHFKGKEVIIGALFSMYRDQMSRIFSSKIPADCTPTDLFNFLLLILKNNYLFRFLYRNSLDLSEKYPIVKKGMLSISSQQEKAIQTFLVQFKTNNWLVDSPDVEKNIIDLVNLICSQSVIFLMSSGDDVQEEECINQCLEWIVFFISPHLGVDCNAFNALGCSNNG